MNVTYRRKMKHNYLIIEPEMEISNGYERWMLMENGIEGLLRFRIKYLDSKEFYYYEITSKQPLHRFLESHNLSFRELKTLLTQMLQTLNRMEAFLLSEEQILLDPEFIYLLPETFQVSMCLLPGKSEAFGKAMSRFLQYLLGKVDHQDKECVVLAYALYQESLKENFGLENLLRCITSEEMKVIPKVQEEVRLESVGLEPEIVKEPEMGREKRPVRNFGRWLGPIVMGLIGCLVLYRIFGIPKMIPYAVILCTVSGLIWIPMRESASLFRNKEEQKQNKTDSWKMVFQEETMEIRDPVCPINLDLDEHNTVLLTNLNRQPDTRRLVPLEGGADIVLSHFPFIIGKQEGLVDYVLDREAVSRLHFRIDQDKEGYRITDLNSTNGTKLNTHMLEVNEMSYLVTGDKIFVANMGFRFI